MDDVVRRAARVGRSQLLMPVRRRLARGGAGWVRAIPVGLRRRLDLDGARVEPLRVELGGGAYPTPGYVHIDQSRYARHLEYVAPVWDLPLPDSSVTELLAVHVFEHVHPARVGSTLAEWRRVLRPGGMLRVHVPNAAAVLEAYRSGGSALKWALIGSGLFGMNSGPSIREPEDFDEARHQPDHKALYDFPLLRETLTNAGFSEIVDRTGHEADRHTEGWAGVVPDMSLIVHARADSGGTVTPQAP